MRQHRGLLVVMDPNGTAEVAWDRAMVSRLPGLAAVYDVDGGGETGILRPVGFDTELPAPAGPAALQGVPPRFAVALAPASESWRPGPVLHRVTYTWAGTLPYDTYEWPDNVPCTLPAALARCRVRLERGRQHAAIRLADRARRRWAEAWGESVLLRALEPAQTARFQAERCFVVQAQSGRRYLITAARRRNVYALDGAGRPRAAYSLLPAVPGSLAEQLWQQTWLLRHDERRFLRFAWRPNRKRAGSGCDEPPDLPARNVVLVSALVQPGTAAAARPALAFELPAALLAGEPPEARGLSRDSVRLMVSRGRACPVAGQFRDLPGHLRPGDLVVVNTSSTLPARRPDGRTAMVRLAVPLGADGPWVVELPVEPDPEDQPWPGEAWVLPGQGHLHLLVPYRGSWRLWLVDVRVLAPLPAWLAEHALPLRPDGVAADWPLDLHQSCFAHEPGSTAMASAGRAFTPELLTALVAGGVVVAPLLLHTCGVAGEDGCPLPEPFQVPPVTARLVNHTRAAGGRVIAVGTTVVRALETVAAANGVVRPACGRTELVVTLERGVRVVDGLLTGWHEPGGSHLRLLEAVAGLEPLELAYRAALEHGFAWGAFGDLHLILPGSRRRALRAS